jgi:hypothetical protein
MLSLEAILLFPLFCAWCSLFVESPKLAYRERWAPLIPGTLRVIYFCKGFIVWPMGDAPPFWLEPFGFIVVDFWSGGLLLTLQISDSLGEVTVEREMWWWFGGPPANPIGTSNDPPVGPCPANIWPTFESLFVNEGSLILLMLVAAATWWFSGRFLNVYCPVFAFVKVAPPISPPAPESVGKPFFDGELFAFTIQNFANIWELSINYHLLHFTHLQVSISEEWGSHLALKNASRSCSVHWRLEEYFRFEAANLKPMPLPHL